MTNLVVRSRRVLDNINDLGVFDALLETDDKTNGRHVLRRDTERQTAEKANRSGIIINSHIQFIHHNHNHHEKNTSNSRQLAIQARNNLPDCLRRTRTARDNVPVDTTATAPVLRRRPIDGLLRRRRRVDGRHQSLDDATVLVDDLGERREAVGRAGGVGDLFFGFELGGLTHPKFQNPKPKISHPSSHHQHKQPKNHTIHSPSTQRYTRTSRRPGDSRRVALVKDGDGLAVDDELAVLGHDGALVAYLNM
jgi:hypothetical protein